MQADNLLSHLAQVTSFGYLKSDRLDDCINALFKLQQICGIDEKSVFQA
jgi:hypothetical protein